MDQRDSEGYRLGPDGNTFVIPFETGAQPPEDVKIFLEKVASISEVSPEEGRRVFDECKQMLYDNIYYFVHIERQMQPLIINADLGNVSESPEAFAIASNFAGEQFFFRQ